MPERVTVVTVTYGDRWGYLEKVLARLDDLDRAERIAAIVVVANGAALSARRRLDAAAARDSRIQVVPLGANRGSAAGFAAGIARALELDGEAVWLLDDDNLPEPGALRALLATHAAHPEAALQALRPGHPSLQPAIPGTDRLRWGVYGGLFASRCAFAAAGLPREDFVLYGDDTEYTYRFPELRLVTGSVIADLEEPWWAQARRRGDSRSAVPGLRGGPERRRMYYTVRNSLFFRFHRVREGRLRLVAGVAAKSAALVLLALSAAVQDGTREPLRNVAGYVLASWHGLRGRLGAREGWR